MQTGCIDENYFEPYDIRVNMSFAEWLKLAVSGLSALGTTNSNADTRMPVAPPLISLLIIIRN